VYELSEAQITAVQGSRRALNAPFGDRAVLETASLGPRMAVRPGETIRLALTWRTLTSSQDNYGAFIHVVDPAGNVVAQADRQGLPVGGWLPGQRFLSVHLFGLLSGTPPGHYRVLAGLSRLSTDVQPSRSLGELGPQVEVLALDVPS
jgi:hypothetical protein